MKIDKRNPVHWIHLVAFALTVALALVLRPFRRRGGLPLVLCYGHKLTGNLRALYSAVRAARPAPCSIAFLTMDPDYYRALLAARDAAVLARGLAAAWAIASARVIVSDHGLHVMGWLPWLTSIRFVDVWHGVPFKGWDATDFRTQHRYDEIWVSSSLMRRYYLERFGFREGQVFVTGYGRTDRLVVQREDPAQIRRHHGVPPAPARLVLFAPTWHHDGGGADVFPFGSAPAQFLALLGETCTAHGASCLFRTHLNTRAAPVTLRAPFVPLPQDRYPDSEAVLLMSDVLICDWSSIAFDWLVLDRPTIFLDVPAPFPKGYTLGPEFRYGAVVSSLDALCTTLARYLSDPDAYRREYGARAAEVRRAAYDDLADGQASARYLERLRALL